MLTSCVQLQNVAGFDRKSINILKASSHHDFSKTRELYLHLPSISQYVIVEFDAHSWDWPHLATFEVRHVTSYRINIKSMFVFSGLTSFFIDFNFCRQIKSLFIFSGLTSFFPQFQFFPSSQKFVYFQCFDEFFPHFFVLQKGLALKILNLLSFCV